MIDEFGRSSPLVLVRSRILTVSGVQVRPTP